MHSWTHYYHTSHLIRKRDSMVNISSKEANRCHQLNMDSQMVQVPELVISFHYYFFIKKKAKINQNWHSDPTLPHIFLKNWLVVFFFSINAWPNMEASLSRLCNPSSSYKKKNLKILCLPWWTHFDKDDTKQKTKSKTKQLQKTKSTPPVCFNTWSTIILQNILWAGIAQ